MLESWRQSCQTFQPPMDARLPRTESPTQFGSISRSRQESRGPLPSGFLYADFILNNQFKTKWARLPINVTLEYLNNLNASEHPFDFTVKSTAGDGNPDHPPTTSQPATIASLGKQSHAYFAEASIGQQKNKGDIQAGYAFLRQDKFGDLIFR